MRLTALIMALAALFGLHAQENGVSATLAKQRSAEVSNPRYSLSFRIPEALIDPVEGELSLTFDFSGTGSLLLDFQGRVNPEAELNGKRFKAAVTNEHIILPAKLLRKGGNKVKLRFQSSDKALNRHADYMYSLFVPALARSVFPAFDQPDLKARFSLELDMPSSWTAQSAAAIKEDKESDGRRHIVFAESDPLPTYLFSFSAGEFQEYKGERAGLPVRILHRHTGDDTVAELEKILNEAGESIAFMESYTGIRMPFQCYNMVILPGYQFGGMEHPGATQFRGETMFPGASATAEDYLKRFQLIAHETAHLWFGDLVTMRWFDDVWTKEVFANFMADKACRVKFPDADYTLRFLRNYQAPALETDRTAGTNPIQQPLDNLNAAGLLYGNIIYDKAPVMMTKLETLLGTDVLQKGLQAYLRKFSYANSTWDDLIAVLDSVAPGSGVADFSEVWVKREGMPTVTASLAPDGKSVTVVQTDPRGRGLEWPQTFVLGWVGEDGHIGQTIVDLSKETAVYLPQKAACLLPNLDGTGYGLFPINISLDDLAALRPQMSPVERYAALANVLENHYSTEGARFDAPALFSFTATALESESEETPALYAADFAARLLKELPADGRAYAEKRLLKASATHPVASVKQRLLRGLLRRAISAETTDSLYSIWADNDCPLLNESDMMLLAVRLAMLKPESRDYILSTQRQRLSSADKEAEFDFISRGAAASKEERLAAFESLLPPEGRRVEPWAITLLSLLNDEICQPESISYLRPAIEALPQIQRSSDIFFPGQWVGALVSGHTSAEAASIVTRAAEEVEMLPALRLKLLENSHHLLNQRR